MKTELSICVITPTNIDSFYEPYPLPPPSYNDLRGEIKQLTKPFDEK